MTGTALETNDAADKDKHLQSSPPSVKHSSNSSIEDESGPQAFQFTGTGGEYFRIWIVNLLLIMATLGIYSAWAKVRRQQYFYRNTQVAGASFDYLGTPAAILKGRMIAFGLFVVYNIAFTVSPVMAAIVSLALVAMAPWLLARALRFRMANSAYRNVRFHFRGSVGQAYRMFLWFPVMLVLSGLVLWGLSALFPENNETMMVVGFSVLITLAYVGAVPLYHYLLKRYQHGNAYLGRMPFAFEASAVDFFKVYGVAVVCVILGIVALAVSMGITTSVHMMSENTFTEVLDSLYSILAIYIFYMFFIAYFEGKMQNLVWNKTSAEGVRFESKVKLSKLLFIHATNLLLIVLTIGLYKPFATVRRIKYRVECMTLIPVAGSLDNILADHSNEHVGAMGEEAGEMFDVDIAL
jgi:uncharacterized membrane protein YjgN (DUF898 family)